MRKRREFITNLRGISTWPLAAPALRLDRVCRVGAVLPATRGSNSSRPSFTVALASMLFILLVPLRGQAVAEDALQAAINYVFTGKIAPENGPKIVDLKSCVVVIPDQKFKRYVRYYLSRFKMDGSRISKTYSGRQTKYTLEVDGDEAIIEYLSLDQATVTNGYKSAQIPLPGNIDQTERALHLIFTEHCKSDEPKAPF